MKEMKEISTRWLIVHSVMWVTSALVAMVLQEPNVMIAPIVGSAVALSASGHISW